MFKHDSTFILREFKTARPNELKCAVMLFDGMVAVSYTHLDVYKRQV